MRRRCMYVYLSRLGDKYIASALDVDKQLIPNPAEGTAVLQNEGARTSQNGFNL